jgi:hypothetical protein
MQFRTTSMGRAALSAVAAALTLTLAACGGGSSGSTSSSPSTAGNGNGNGNGGYGGAAGTGRGFDPQAMQSAVNDFTACLREQGLEVKDITIGANRPRGSTPEGTRPSGEQPRPSFPRGSVPPDGEGQQGGRHPGGFNFTDRILQQLGLDTSDAKVTKAVDACSSSLQNALPSFGQGRRGGTTTTTQT